VGFRDAHRIVGEAVGYSLQEKKELHALTLEELRKFSPAVDEDVFEALSVASAINRRTSIGGTARENVCAAIRAAEEALGLK
jgi:argininosuccinate lyase